MAATGGNAGAPAATSSDALTLIGGGFASLLLSQISPVSQPALPQSTSAEKDDGTKDDTASNNDFSALFAALGIPQAPVPLQVSQTPGKADLESGH
ncbi:MAG: hypothetical protein KGN39_12690, partial [Betaproteobacteria bacterium]|nr:hypothetical protein [Betaproteobacteria bacterium]